YNDDLRAYPKFERERYHYSLFNCCQGMYQLGSPYWEQFFPRTARTLVDDLALAADGSLVGVCVHGSAVLGDFIPGASDLDVLVVVEDDVDDALLDRVTDTLASDRSMPATGLEASVVARTAAASPAKPWPFRVHVTTAPEDRKVVSGRTHSGDPDLVLHYAVARERGWSATGPPPTELFGSLPTSIVLEQIADELRWAADNGSASYAVLNACRALCFSLEGRICSKSQGGEWALLRGIEPQLVAAALDARAQGTRPPPDPVAKRWVLAAADDIRHRLQSSL
ncbi:MAG: DUF4111 domain-containing protein, partial [Actinobacteria bacterium]